MKRILFHWPLDPASREIRLALGEKRLSFDGFRLDLPGDTKKLLKMNPGGQPPILREEEPGNTRIIADHRAIFEYLEETRTNVPLLPKHPVHRAEVRRMMAWFSGNFQSEVLGYLLYERIEKPLSGLGAPDASVMRQGKKHLQMHLQYFEQLLEQRDWICGDTLTMADLCAAAALSCLDYFGDIPFEKYPLLKSWYVRLKSRPSFRPLLLDTFPGMPPSAHYSDLDF